MPNQKNPYPLPGHTAVTVHGRAHGAQQVQRRVLRVHADMVRARRLELRRQRAPGRAQHVDQGLALRRLRAPHLPRRRWHSRGAWWWCDKAKQCQLLRRVLGTYI